MFPRARSSDGNARMIRSIATQDASPKSSRSIALRSRRSTSGYAPRSTRRPTKRRSHRHPKRSTRWKGSTPIRRAIGRTGIAKAERLWMRTSVPKGGARTRARKAMPEITYLEAIREAHFEEMDRDANVFCIGEDIGAYGGAFKVTDGLLAKYGEQRVIDSPISEIGRAHV